MSPKNPKITDNQLYTITETAELLEGITEQTVSNYLRQKKLLGEKRGPKSKWFVWGHSIKKMRKDWKLD